MADFKERRFSIDPGRGKKMDGCPYSIYEDGHDVKDYIIPPKGYIFKGFRFDPDASNQIYDGKLIAIYEKETFNQKMMSQMWKFILAFAIIAVIAIIAILAAGVFKDPSPKPSRQVDQPAAVVEANEPAPVVVDTTETETVETTSASEEQSAETVVEEVKPQEETTQPVADDPNELFKQAFWTLIHQRTILMDAYDTLFKDNKGKVEGEEYDYLRFTILKDFPSFKQWSSKLRNISPSDAEQIHDISTLKERIKATE